jgi:hypothetical protein
MKNFPCDLILNQEKEGVKLYEDLIIICKAMNREEIFGGIRNMKNITKAKTLIGSAYY